MFSRHTLLSLSLPLCALLAVAPCPAAASLRPSLIIERGKFVLPPEIVPHRVALLVRKISTDQALQPPQIAVTKPTKPSKQRRKKPLKNRIVTLTQRELAQAWQPEPSPAPIISQWQRPCTDLGYSETIIGTISGETILDKANNQQTTRWLKNECAAQPIITATPSQPTIPAPPTPMVSSTPPLPPPAPPAPAAATASCGKAALQPTAMMPADNLCERGTANIVVGQGPWQWECVLAEQRAFCFAPIDLAEAAQKKTAQQQLDTAPPAISLAVAEPRAIAAAPLKAQQQAALSTPMLTASFVAPATPKNILPAAALSAPPALATPQLAMTGRTTIPAAGVTNYAPAPPLRTTPLLASNSGSDMIAPELRHIVLEAGKLVPDDPIMLRIENLGQNLAVNRTAQITITSYASLNAQTDTRAARRLSLDRALAMRDALMMGGASSDQIRLRAQGANSGTGAPDRIDLTEN